MNHAIKESLSEPIKVTLMQPNDFREINQWCIDEGWNIGLNDSEMYYKIDPMGHYIAKITQSVASLSLIKHSPTFFSLGPFIVNKSYRGQGIGEALWNTALDRMNQEHPDAHIVLCAISEQVARYKKSGFVPALNIQRWNIDTTAFIAPQTNNQCVAITNQLLPSLSNYYQNHEVANRDVLLKELLTKPNTNGLVFMDDNLIKGFGFIRPCIRGFRIGALVADTPDAAQSLIAGLLVFAQNAPVFIDTPESNPHAIDCLGAFNATRAPHRDTVMMIKGTGTTSYLKQREHHYGLFSLEIG